MVFCQKEKSFLLIHTRSSEFDFLIYPLVYLRVWRNNLILKCPLKSSSACLSHQSSIFKIHTSVHVQLSPMAFRSARREALSQPTIGKSLKGTVYPSETKSLVHHFNVWNSRPFGWALTAISNHLTTLLFVVVLFEPLAKLSAILKVKKVDYFHNAISNITELLQNIVQLNIKII